MPKRHPEKYSEIIISHPGSDFDSMASMWAAHLLNPNRPIVMIAGADSNVREFLALYGNEFPRIHLKDIDISSVRHITIVDCSSRSQLNRIEGLLDREDVQIELWDHHREDSPDFRIDTRHYGPVGANTTLLVSELKRKGIIISPEESTLLLLGIYEDTGSLRFPTTTPDDLDAASWLLKTGASLDLVDNFLGIRLTPVQKELLTDLGLNVQVVEVRGIPIHVTQGTINEFVDEIAFLARKVQETELADVIFALVQYRNRVFIIGRSRLPSVNVAQILSIFGGGGHPQAASCLLTDSNHSVALQRLLDVIREQVKPSVLARDIMSTQVRTIDPDVSMDHAHTIIAHTGYSGLVVTENDVVVGVITRSAMDKALGHGLGHAPVKGYMLRDPVTISEETSLREIQKTIIEKHAGFLPVIFAGKVSGVVTRSDVLRALHKVTARPESGVRLNEWTKQDEYGKDLLSRLPEAQLDLLALAGETADSMGVPCYLVGGIVRDLIIERKNFDIDLLIEGDGIEFAHQFASKLDLRTVDSDRFRTAKVVLADGSNIDIATARDEFYIRPGALPEVEAAGIRDDLVRRDFTINTLAIQINTRKWGNLIDHFSGLEDLRNGLIRVLHTFSFVDDPTRILRALRFSERYGFKLEKQTDELLNRALVEGRLDKISPERVRDEIFLCLREDEPWPVCRRICEEGILGLMFQSLYPPKCMCDPVDPVKPAIEWLAQYIPEEEMPLKELVYLTFVLSESDPEEADRFVKDYRFNLPVLRLVDALPKFINAKRVLHDPHSKASDVVFALENIPAHFWVVLVAGKDEDSIEKSSLRLFLTELRSIKTHVSGDDLIREGYKPGPEFRTALHDIRKARIDGEICTKDEEMELAMKILSKK